MNDDLYDCQAKLLYSAIVAGKSARFADAVMGRLLARALDDEYSLPFDAIKAWSRAGELEAILRTVRSGSYTRLSRCFGSVCNLDAETVTCDELEAVHGIGPKTARFFLMWTNPEVRYAALDTHILKFLRSLGHTAPKSTPPAGPVYRRLEVAFIAEADRQGKSPRELDYEVWERYSRSYEQAQQLALLPSTE